MLGRLVTASGSPRRVDILATFRVRGVRPLGVRRRQSAYVVVAEELINCRVVLLQ
jgi:hypothetical protein